MAKDQMKRGLYRSNYCSLLDDPKYRALDSDARLVFLTLTITRLGNAAGIFILDEGGKVTLAAQAGISDKRFRKAFDTLCDTHWIGYQYPVIWIYKRLKNEPNLTLNNPKHRSFIEKIVLGLPKIKIIFNFIDYYKLANPFDTLCDTVSDTPPIPYRNTEQEQETEQETETEQEQEQGGNSEKAPVDKLTALKLQWDKLGLDSIEGQVKYDPDRILNFDYIWTTMRNWVAGNTAKKDWKKFITNWINRELITARDKNEQSGVKDYGPGGVC